MSDKPHFTHDYWINELIEVGKIIDPEKFTFSYCYQLTRAWQQQPLSHLVSKVNRMRQKTQAN